VSDEHDITDDERPREADIDAGDETEASFEQSRHRPPDLVGTRPEWDPATLVPTETPRAAAGRLWAPAAKDGDTEVVDRGIAATAGPDVPPAEAAPTYSRYSARFQFLFGALIAVGAAAVALLVAVAVGGKDDSAVAPRSTAPAWSTWQPLGRGVDAVEEIATHVGRQYRLPSGKQMVIVTGGPMEFADFPATIAVQQPVSQGGGIDLIDGASVLFRLCGTNARTGSRTLDCTISGKPSTDQLLLLRREALELALYSFRYVGVSETVVLLPPAVLKPRDGSGTVTTTRSSPQALLFRRSDPDVQSAIGRPLRLSLTTRTPTVAGVRRSPDSQFVSALTATRLYSSRFSYANQDARAFLLLDPLPVR
jgi:hypothetical protein